MVRDIYEPATFAVGFTGAIYVTRQMLQEITDSTVASDTERLLLLRAELRVAAARQGIAFDPQRPVRYGATHGGFWFINDAQGAPLEWPLKEQSGGMIPDAALGMDR